MLVVTAAALWMAGKIFRIGILRTGQPPKVVEMLRWATRIGGRYMGAAAASAFGQRNAVPGELLVRLRPTQVVARAAIAD